MGFTEANMKPLIILCLLAGWASAGLPLQKRLEKERNSLSHGTPKHQPLAHDNSPQQTVTKPDDEDLAMKQYLGCYEDRGTRRDLPYHIWTRPQDNSASTCIASCRHQHFKYAGTQNEGECYCGNEEGRLYGEAEDCDLACPGHPFQLCGGPSSNSVYRVPEDRRYVGCYEESADDPDLDTLLWGVVEGHNAHACVDACTEQGFRYAGVQDGGACFCGDRYGKHGVAEEHRCWTQCKGFAKQICGGKDANAVYRTNVESDMSSGTMDPATVVAYDGSGQIAGFPTQMYTIYPLLRSIVTNKVVFYASEDVLSPFQDPRCYENCYTPCGEIYHPDDLTYKGETVIIRAFHFNMRDLPEYVGQDTRQVFVHAQTVIIDSNVNTPYSVSVRTRQLIVDRSAAFYVDVATSAPDLDQDEELVRKYGPEPNALYLKMAIMCARILLETREPEHVNTAWAIINNVIDTHGTDEEATNYAESIRSFSGELSGVARADVHFVPFYTKSHLAKILDNLYDTIGLYRLQYDRMVDRTTPDLEYLLIVEDMQRIFIETDINDAEVALQSAVTALEIANATYMRMLEEYENSRAGKDEARAEFEKGLEGVQNQARREAFTKFKDRVTLLALGTVSPYADAVDVEDSMTQIGKDVTGLAQDMQELSRLVKEVYEVMAFAEQLVDHLYDVDNGFDFAPFLDDLELMAEQQVNILRWNTFKNHVDHMFGDDELNIDGATEYRSAVKDLSNWGQALNKAMVEFAEVSRQALEKRFMLQSKLELQRRLAALLEDAKQDIAHRERLTMAMVEQSYDVRLDLNEALIVFCRAYFYENLYECKESYKPAFGGSLVDLLLKINAAKNDDLLIGGAPPSTVRRTVRVMDEDSDPDCEDAAVCPLNYFKKHRLLYFQLPTDHPDIVDLDKYRVAEIIMTFEGAVAEGSNKLLKMRIESSGDFQGRSEGKIYNFLTRSLSLLHEYHISTNAITIHADVYEPYRNIISHITPYTTWVISIDERSDSINLSDVTAIRMRLDGSAVDGHGKAEEEEEVAK